MSETKIGNETLEVEPTVDSLRAAIDAYRADPNEVTAKEALSIYDRMGVSPEDEFTEDTEFVEGTSDMEAWEVLMDEDPSYAETLSALEAERKGGTFNDDSEEWNHGHFEGADSDYTEI